jgi:hypothetical protein
VAADDRNVTVTPSDRVRISGSRIPIGVRLVAGLMLLGFIMVAHEDGSLFLAALGALATFPVLLWRSGATFHPSQRMLTLWKGLGLGGPFYLPLTRTTVTLEPHSLLVLDHEPSNWIPGRPRMNPNDFGLKVMTTRRVYTLALQEPGGRSWTLGAWVWQWLALHHGRKLANAMNLQLKDDASAVSRR